MKRALLFLFSISLLLFCNELFSQSCSDGTYSWDDDISSILAPCMGCHGSAGGLSLTTYAGISAGGSDCSDLLTGTIFVEKITIGGCGGGAMNDNCGGCIDTDELADIQAWINAGAQETCPAIVAVEYQDIEIKSSLNHIRISWTTASEVNSDYFEIYHSLDGVNFSAIGTIRAFGNSNVINQYNFEHLTDLEAKHYYKILQLDFDGNEEWTSIFSHVYTTKDINHELVLYPNPTRGLLNLSFDQKHNPIDHLLIYDLQGKLIKKINSLSAENKQVLDLSDIRVGAYHLCAVMEDATLVRERFVKF